MAFHCVSLRSGQAAASAWYRICRGIQRPDAQFVSSPPHRLASTTSSSSTKDAQKSQQEASAKLASEQRKILADLRAATREDSNSESHAGPRSVTGRPGRTQADDLRDAAEAALRGSRSGVGPISLGMMGDTASTMPGRPSRLDTWTGDGKEWKDLSGGQKVARTTIFSGRLVFVTGGVALTLVLAYALATELLARNSPTVVYGDACKLVENNPEVKQHLLPPFTFHTSYATFAPSDSITSPLPSRRHRNRTVSAAVMRDSRTGDDLMLVRFFVGARDKDKDLSLWQQTRQGVIDGTLWCRERAEILWEDLAERWNESGAAGHTPDEQLARRGGWALLSGTVDKEGQGTLNYANAKLSSNDKPSGGIVASTGRALSGFLGSFVGLTRGQGDAVRTAASAKHEPGTWSSGEVHGELHKDENGVFQFKRLFIDIPSSSSVVRKRVWIVRNGNEVQR
ncbi:hypothetical protein K437DRAFT_236366 [Tilletiaria anomala UBC 951]|uniref:Mitochondrial import inner membrane translocase subunit TIM21 n=1 Tax=Tilletiaria anomala (strain ATCC 24038 / CBS 436.72 / UBC 951) TaxID=1037660 RepID=A0A066VT87_TILAU|nr:uncharacterized protein K437DRAFT_236366 [Tilletiaria anomala UBC 951]KDN44686.1 hypothetical protein K437DRAFT_236366 [Tilletiaria anomala UBC 951]